MASCSSCAHFYNTSGQPCGSCIGDPCRPSFEAAPFTTLALPELTPVTEPGWDDLPPSLPEDASQRNEYPMAEGLLDYFPNALAEVSRLSFAATQQHHPDEPMHWDRGKSTDHRNKILRHAVDMGKLDDKGQRHSTMVAWRALAALQEELERAHGLPPSRASRNRPF